MNSNKQIRFGALLSYCALAINIIITLSYTPWVLRTIGSSQYGLFTLANSLIALFLMDFGMSAAITRFIAKYRAEKNQKKINSFVGIAVKFYLIVTAILACVLCAVFLRLGKIYANLTPEELALFRIVFAITASFVVVCFPVNVCNGILNAYEQYVGLKSADLINRVGTVFVTIGALAMNRGLIALIVINGTFNLLTFLSKIILITKTTPVRIDFKRSSLREVKDIFTFSVWTTITSIAQQANFNMIPSVLAMVANTQSITMFGFASAIEGYVYSITNAINGLFLPKISRLIVNDDNAEKILPLMIRVGRINQSIVSILLIGLMVVGREFIHLWLGDEFRSLYWCILMLTVPYIVAASQQVANSSIIALNKVMYTSLIYVATGLTNILAAYTVAGKFGVVGVCVVIFTTFCLRVVLLNVVYVTKLKINIWSFFKECQIKMLPALLTAAVLSCIFVRFVPSSEGIIGWLFFLSKVGITVIIYVITMWMIGWNRFEKDLILSVFRVRK